MAKFRNLILFSLLFACASAPKFAPSTPIEQAKGFHEALLLCNEYQLPSSPDRPLALRPFRDCVRRVGEVFPQPPEGSFSVFRDELDRLYASLSDSQWSHGLGQELETAIHVCLRALWRNGSTTPVATPLERDMVLRHFPRSAVALHASRWWVSTQAAMDPKLEQIKAGLSGLLQDGTAASLPTGEVTQEVAETCHRLEQLRSDVDYLSLLWRDQYDITQLAPQSPESARIREKYANRLSESAERLERLRPDVERLRAGGSFRASACRNQS